RIKWSKICLRSAASAPNVISATVLASAVNDFDYIDGLLFAAQRAVLCIEVVDRLADQTVQARPLIIRFRGIRHDQSLSLEALLDLCAGLVSMRPSALRMASVFSRVLRSDGFS